MEMTDRRPITATTKRARVTGDEEDGTGTGWCNDKYVLRNRTVGATGNNNNRWGGFSRMKKSHMIICVVAVLSLLHFRSKVPTMSDVEDGAHVVKKNVTGVINSEGNSTAATASESDMPLSSPPTKESPMESDTSVSTKESVDPEPTLTESGVDEPIIRIDDTKTLDEPDLDNGGKKNDTLYTSHDESRNTTNTTEIVSQQNSMIEENTELQEEAQNIDEGEDSSDFEKNETDYKAEMNSTVKSDEDEIVPTISPSSSLPKSNETNMESTKKVISSKVSGESNHDLPKLKSDSDLSAIALNFVETHCDLSHLKEGSWYPSGSEDGWQQRAPYLIVAGVWNAGVNPLAKALLKHPQIDAAKQNGFFLPKQFQRYYDFKSTDSNVNSNNQTMTAFSGRNFNVKVFAARERMYAQVYSKAMLREKLESNDDNSTAVALATNESNGTKNQQVAMDVSPGLIFYARKTAHSILCTAPWVKIVVLLRNPIDRLYQQWSYSVTHLGLKLTLEDWMAQEMKLLQSVGMIGGDNAAAKDDPNMALSEMEAWQKYQSVHNIAGAIGRSLYVYQLEEWIQAYVSAGKTPSEEMIILTTEDIEEDPEHQYAELIQFLGLAPLNSIPKNDNDADSIGTALGKSLSEKSDARPMAEETRIMLRNFFKPYNKRLTKLLTSNGFEGDWENRWE